MGAFTPIWRQIQENNQFLKGFSFRKYPEATVSKNAVNIEKEVGQNTQNDTKFPVSTILV